MSLPEVTVKFKEIEQRTQRICFKIGCEILKSVLEDWDKFLMENRDKAVYRHVGRKPTVIKTVKLPKTSRIKR